MRKLFSLEECTRQAVLVGVELLKDMTTTVTCVARTVKLINTPHSAMFFGTVPFTTGIARLQNLFAPCFVVLDGVTALLQLCL